MAGDAIVRVSPCRQARSECAQGSQHTSVGRYLDFGAYTRCAVAAAVAVVAVPPYYERP